MTDDYRSHCLALALDACDSHVHAQQGIYIEAVAEMQHLQLELAASQKRVKALEDLMAELNKLCAEKDKQVRRAGVAYEAGRDAGIDETIAACLASLKELGVVNRIELSERIKSLVATLKSDTEGGV